jgi:nucleotide-binding universal stress UspA family protein
MIRRIVAASDGSDGANRAIDVVASLARGCDAELWLVNAINDHGLSTDQLNEFRHVEHVSLGQFLALLSAQLLVSAEYRARRLGATTIQLESRYGDPAQVIMEIAREKNADAIVLGKRGGGTLVGELVGSVSQKLASLAPCMVIIVP